MRFWQSRLGHYRIFDLFGLLVFGSVFGLAFETLYMFIMKGEWFSRRGLLFLPLCPLYGIALTISAVLPAVCRKTILRLWLTGCLAGSMLEYLASFLMEKTFSLRWWDYSYWPYNLNGRIWLPMSLVWGLVVIACNRWVAPWLVRTLKKIPQKLTEVFFALLLILIIMDVSLTTIGIYRFANRHEIIQGPDWLSTDSVNQKPWLKELDQTLFSDHNIYKIFPYMAAKTPTGWERVTILEQSGRLGRPDQLD